VSEYFTQFMTKNRHYKKNGNKSLFLNALKIPCMNHALFEVFLVCRYDGHMYDENKKLDFDSAMRLAQDNPDAFERYRCEAIDGLIARIPVHNQ